MSIFRKFSRAMRGEVSPRIAMLEGARRTVVAMRRRSERGRLKQQAEQPARLAQEFARLPTAALLDHFRQRSEPHSFSGFDLPFAVIRASQQALFAEGSAAVLARAESITNDKKWPLLGLAHYKFTDWHRDPLSGYDWSLDFSNDIKLLRDDGSDVRFVWELNRLGHFITLARAYSLTEDERFSREFFRQLESWDQRNPFGFGVNWNCAMEAALRVINLLGAFAVFRRAPNFDDEKLARFLKIFDLHGRFIREHLEFSYIATSNHYLANIAGLLWLGIMLPELEDAKAWRAFGLREMQREMDKQVLADGADYENSTGYHRLVLELFAYSFLLCRLNGIEIEKHYWETLRKMFGYLKAYLRPDGLAPLLGDSDSGQVFPICQHAANDHGYLLALGAVLFEAAQLKDDKLPIPAELIWVLGEEGVAKYRRLTGEIGEASQQFPDAGIYVLRDSDFYLLFNASGAGLNGRGSHGHNDALSIEVSAFGRAFIVDPGSYVYTADLHERHLFRSTAYHSTVQIDDVEQNQTVEEIPFVIGNEGQPRLVGWFPGNASDKISAEHFGYKRLSQPVTHRRTVTFHKEERAWLIEDEFFGDGEHKLAVRFHFDSGLEVTLTGNGAVRAADVISGNRLFVRLLDGDQSVQLEEQFTSRDYGQKSASVSACWILNRVVPANFRWQIIPVSAGEDETQRSGLNLGYK
jgi:hypothetical protein